MRKKTRNVISGILVCIASVFAVINYSEMPADEVGRFLLSTVIFFVGIVVLALAAVSVFKLLGWMKRSVLEDDDGRDAQSADEIDRE